VANRLRLVARREVLGFTSPGGAGILSTFPLLTFAIEIPVGHFKTVALTVAAHFLSLCMQKVASLIGKSTYFVDLGPIFFIYFCAREMSKAGKNHSALVLIESTVGSATILPQLVAM
jgi:hypothetical protein